MANDNRNRVNEFGVGATQQTPDGDLEHVDVLHPIYAWQYPQRGYVPSSQGVYYA